jgi:hypothetical protein
MSVAKKQHSYEIRAVISKISYDNIATAFINNIKHGPSLVTKN